MSVCLLLLVCLLGTLAAGYGMIALVVIVTSPVNHIPSCHCTLVACVERLAGNLTVFPFRALSTTKVLDPSVCSESGVLELALWSRTKTSTRSTDESAFPRTAQPRAKD